MALTFSEPGHRYRLDGQPVPSVSTISKLGGGCEGLIKWSAEVTAEYSFDHQELAASLARQAYVDLVATESRRRRDEAARAGVAVHELAQQLLAGVAVQVPDYLVPRVRQAITLIERHDMQALASEVLVGSRTVGYGGRLDTISTLTTVELGEHLALVDWKTGKGFWTDVAMQGCGYWRADFWVDHQKQEQPMPPIQAFYIAHIKEDSAELYPIQVTDDTWLAFRAARRLWEQVRLKRDDVIGPALEHPASFYAADVQTVGEPL